MPRPRWVVAHDVKEYLVFDGYNKYTANFDEVLNVVLVLCRAGGPAIHPIITSATS